MVRRSRLPSSCNRVRASGLSDPLVTFRTNYPDLNINHCDSLRNLQLSQDVLDIIPSDVVLDPRRTGPEAGLDTVKFAQSKSVLANTWLQSAKAAKSRLAARPIPFRRQASNEAANQQAEQCAAFAEASSGPDAYVLKCLCHQVIVAKLLLACLLFTQPYDTYSITRGVLQLVWSSDADNNVKARACAVISHSMAFMR